MKTKIVLAVFVLVVFSGCGPYYRDSYGRYPDRYGRTDDHGFSSAGPHTVFGNNYGNDRGGVHSGNEEARRHDHMAAERRHLEEEQREDQDRHYGSRY